VGCASENRVRDNEAIKDRAADPANALKHLRSTTSAAYAADVSPERIVKANGERAAVGQRYPSVTEAYRSANVAKKELRRGITCTDLQNRFWFNLPRISFGPCRARTLYNCDARTVADYCAVTPAVYRNTADQGTWSNSGQSEEPLKTSFDLPHKHRTQPQDGVRHEGEARRPESAEGDLPFTP
jgi:hypothetical protein